MYGYTEYLWNEAKNETLLNAYTNMKKANAKDEYICTMLGISKRKLREIKRLFKETITRETTPLT